MNNRNFEQKLQFALQNKTIFKENIKLTHKRSELLCHFRIDDNNSNKNSEKWEPHSSLRPTFRFGPILKGETIRRSHESLASIDSDLQLTFKSVADIKEKGKGWRLLVIMSEESMKGVKIEAPINRELIEKWKREVIRERREHHSLIIDWRFLCTKSV